MSMQKLIRGLVRVHAGFAVVRIRSLGITWPKKWNVDLLEKFMKKTGED
ncbi:hypothetical protein [Thermococcus gorgonarius]|nr:hypothetical protein [Thermococcus gorgonarius]